MKISIYQINLEKDIQGAAFESYENLKKMQPDFRGVDSSVYQRVFDGEVAAKDLEDVYRIFNIDRPGDYRGRSLSVSDVVRVSESENVASGFYYCDSIGFRQVDFDPAESGVLKRETVKVVMCEPGKTAFVTEVGTDLPELQKTVEGCIEVYYPFAEDVCIVCNDEGKMNGSAPCRGIYADDGKLMDVVFGRFFICGCAGDSFSSLTREQQEKYLGLFDLPERFYRICGEIKAEKYTPAARAAGRETV